MQFEIKISPQDVAPFIEEVANQADSNKEALGFLPRSIYQQQSYQGKLLVAVARNTNGAELYAGHLLYGGVFPHARIFQLYVAPEFRNQKVSARLLDFLKEKLFQESWLGITAKVASDLEANTVWERLGFATIRTAAGGVSRGRTINIRALDLKTPSLFDYLPAKDKSQFRLFRRITSLRPLYLIDLNVFFDLIKRRPRSTEAGAVFRAGLENNIRLMIADEFISELERTSNNVENDAALNLAQHYGRLKQPPKEVNKTLFPILASIIFSEKAKLDNLNAQDKSDLTHLITAIHHKVSGFITNEKAILRAARTLREEYQLDILGVAEFAELTKTDTPAPIMRVNTDQPNKVIHRKRVSPSDLEEVRSFLIDQNAPDIIISDALSTGHDQPERIAVYEESKLISYAQWRSQKGPQPSIEMFLCTDESYVNSEAVTESIIELIILPSRGLPCLVNLRIAEGHTETRQVAISRGFTPPDDHPDHSYSLQRLSVPKVISSENWTTIRHQIRNASGIAIPSIAPPYHGLDQTLEISFSINKTIQVRLQELERYFSPAIFLLPGRDGVIVPIRHDFSEDLFRSSPQGSLLAAPEAILRVERIYVSSSRNISTFSEGAPIIFYESLKGAGRGCAIAVARITKVELVHKNEAVARLKKRGVVDQKYLDKLSASEYLTETSFDNILAFNNPVELDSLRKLGCIDKTNLVKAKRLSSDQILAVTREGLSNVQV